MNQSEALPVLSKESWRAYLDAHPELDTMLDQIESRRNDINFVIKVREAVLGAAKHFNIPPSEVTK